MSMSLNRREFLAVSAAALSAPALAAGAEAVKPVWPFYAFDNGLRGPGLSTPEAKCKLLKDLGYKGMQYHIDLKEMPRMLEQLDKHGLKMYGLYVVPMMDKPIDAALAGAIKMLNGRDTHIDLGLRSGKFKPSDPLGDATAAEFLKEISDLCADTGPAVAIYPHAGFWSHRVEDGIRAAQLAGRKNVGTAFNLVHWQWAKPVSPLEPTLRKALPHLFAVTINGLDGRRILPLDQGTLDVTGFMRTVKKAGYTGQVGLQCYSVPDPSEQHLKRSMSKWRAICKELGVGRNG